MPTKIIKEIAEFFGKKLDHVGVEIKGAEVVTIKGEKGDPGKDAVDGKDSIVPGPIGPRGLSGMDGKRGNKFIGTFDDEKDLPLVEVYQQGDFAIVNGVIWYIV